MERLLKFFRENLSLKIGAIFFAALLWFHTVTEKTYDYNFEITRSVIHIPEGYRLVDDSIPNVEARLSGKGKSLLECFDENALYLDIDLSGYHAGSFEYPVDVSSIVLPKAELLSVVEIIFPRFIRLQLVKES